MFRFFLSVFSFLTLMSVCLGLEQTLPGATGVIELKEGGSIWKPDPVPFETREHAGRLLAQELLKKYGIDELADAVILACPRGGLVYAKEIIDEIRRAGGSPTLDLVVCRKIPLPGDDEYGIGGLTEQGEPIYITEQVKYFNLDLESEVMKQQVEKTEKEVRRRIEAYRQEKLPVSVADKVVVVVDGISNGGTLIACIASIRARSETPPQRIILATPVVSKRGKITVMNLANIPEQDFCMAAFALPPKDTLWNSDDFYQKTDSFVQMTDQDVRNILQNYRMR